MIVAAASKDSPFVQNFDTLLVHARSVFGGEVRPLADVVADTVPPHIVGGKVLVMMSSDAPTIFKLGTIAAVRAEAATLQAVAALLREKKVPYRSPVALRLHYIDADIGALELPFFGHCTVESYRRTASATDALRMCKDIAAALGALNVMWLDIMPRNIVISNGECPALVDWERGTAQITDANTYVGRCVQLMEEFWPVQPGVVPYWSVRWPTFPQLERSRKTGIDVDLVGLADPRLSALASELGVDMPTDLAEIFRAYRIFSALAHDEFAVRSMLYAADHLTEFAGLAFRAFASVLAWTLLRRDALAAFHTLRRAIIASGDAIYVAWRLSDVGKIEAIVARLARKINNIGLRALGPDYLSDAHAEARQYLTLGSRGFRERFEVLQWV